MDLSWKAANSTTWVPLKLPRYLVQRIEGLGGVEVDLQTGRSPNQDGVTLLDQILGPRQISIHMVVFGPTVQSFKNARSQLHEMLNPKLGVGVLRVEHDGSVYRLEAVADGSPFWVPDSRGLKHQEVMIHLMAPTPFFMGGEASKGLYLVGADGGLTFAAQFPVQFSVLSSTDDLFNYGHVDTPIEITFYGPATEPRVDNVTTGKHIEVIQPLLAGEYLKINTRFGNKSVLLHDVNGDVTNAMHYITMESEFWQLIPGNNTLTYYAAVGESGPGDAMVEIAYDERYLGV